MKIGAGVLPQPRRRVLIWRALSQQFQSLGRPNDPPDEGEHRKEQTDDDERRQQAQKSIEKADPEGTDLESVVGPDPFRRVGPVHVSHDHADDAGHPDDQADEIEDVDDPGALALGRVVSCRHRERRGRGQAAAFRLAASRSSTCATVWSTIAFRMPYCAAMSCTSRSVRSMLGTPLLRARAAEDGRTRSFAAAAYFSNGTRSLGDAPSFSHTPHTQL